MPTKTHAQSEWGDEKIVLKIYGITRTPLFNLRKAGLVRSVSLKLPGASYGKRLYHIPSVAAYIADCEAREASTVGGAK